MPRPDSRPGSIDRRRSRVLRLEALEDRRVLSTVLGTGTSALLGNDLTDPENDGIDSANNGAGANFNWLSTSASTENNFSPGGPSNEGALDVFDNKLGSGEAKWCCTGPTQWLAVRLDRPYALTHFTLASANDVPDRDPDIWEIQGSDDGVAWQTIYRYDNNGVSPFPQRLQVVRFDGGGVDFDTPPPFSWFRYQALSVVSGSTHQIGEWELFGVGGLAVLNADPGDGEIVFPAPTSATFDFSLDVDPASVDPSDLRVDGIAATGLTIVDADTVRFHFPALEPGEHTMTIAAGAIDPLDPADTLASYSSSFTVPEPPRLANLPAADIFAHSAEIGISVLSTGGDEPERFLYWGDEDGGTDPSGWDHVIPLGSGGVGVHATGLAGLASDTRYFYRGRAVNLAGETWAEATSEFSTLPLTLPGVSAVSVLSTSAFAAQVSGRITDYGGDSPTIRIHYGTHDGGEDPAAWEHVIELGETAEFFESMISGLAPETTYYASMSATNEFGTGWSPTPLMLTTLPAPQLRISEVLASNSTGLSTRTRVDSALPFTGSAQRYDWIEIENLSALPVDLAGVHLTDERDDPFGWTFPTGTVINGGSFLVVFASGLDIVDATLDERRIPHTDFSLSSDGEYVALTAGDGTVLDSLADGFPAQVPDVSFGWIGNELNYLTTPTPGAANSGPIAQFVADTEFNVDRGFHDTPFELVIRSDTEGATIRYTLDGSTPTATSGLVYAGPILIDRTTTVRALAAKAGMRSTNVDTQTYVFLDDVVTQSHQSTLAAGFPATWNGQPANYGLDTDVIGPNDLYGGKYARTIRDDLRSIPTLSIVTDIDNLFGSSGIYSNPNNHDLEVPTSLELIHADGTPGFQINAGLKIQGGAFRNFSLTSKNSFRLKFKTEYGDSTLEYPLFGADAVDEFDTITLRMEANDGWQWTTSTNRLYARDEFGRRTQLAMGQPGSHGTRAHLYLNGVYWGVYNPVERPDETFASRYIGGEKDQWDIQNSGRAINGNLDSWNTLLTLASAVAAEAPGSPEQLAAWHRLNGDLPDGSDDPNQEDYLDVDNYIDYLIVNFYGGNSDWPHKNYYAGRLRGEESEGYQFFMWDSEWSLNLQSNATTDRTSESSGIAQPYALLRNVPEFQMRFADRVQRHFFNGGALYVDPLNPDWDPGHPERNVPAARFSEIVEPLRSPLVAESARWGDQHGAGHTVDESWRPQVVDLLRNYFPVRSLNVLQDFRAAGLYSPPPTPTFNPRGGPVSSNSDILVAAAQGTIYYTTDGSDPRLTGGGVNPSAIRYDGPIRLNETTTVRARAVAGDRWSAIDEALFLVDAVAADATNLRVTEINYNPHDALAELGELNFGSGQFEFVEVRNVGGQTVELGGVRFVDTVVDGDTEGIRFTFRPQRLAPGESISVVADREAFQSRYGTRVSIALGDADTGADDGQFAGQLSNGGETLALLAADGQVIQRFAYDDSDDWPGRADGNGSSLEIVDASGDYEDPRNWRNSQQLGGSPSADGAVVATSVVVNEVLTHTDPPDVDSIELYNTSDAVVDVGGWYLSDDNDDYFKFRVPDGTTIDAGGFVTFTEADFNAPGADSGFALDGARGDDVWLLSASVGEPIRFVDRIEFGAAAAGESLGRWPDGLGELHPLSTVTLGAPNALPRVGPVVVSEIMYLPSDPDGPGGLEAELFEFLELHNPTAQPVDLTGWKLDDAVEYEFPAGAQLPAEGVLVLVPFDPNDPAVTTAFRIAYGIPPSVMLLGGYSRMLGDDGDDVLLTRPDAPPAEEPDFFPSLREDLVPYEVAEPWPRIESGLSLRRVDAEVWGSEPGNWIAAEPDPGFVSFAVDSTSPVVESVVVNQGMTDPPDLSIGPQPTNWSTQRYDLRRIDVTFSEFVVVDRSHFRLVNLGLDAPNEPDVEVPLTDVPFSVHGAVVSLRFEPFALADGVYRIEVLDSVTDLAGNSLDGNGDGVGGDAHTTVGNGTNRLFRRIGDWNGDGGTSIFDFSTFAYWFGHVTPRAPEYVDVNSDGGVSIFDFGEFAAEYGRSVRFPDALAVATPQGAAFHLATPFPWSRPRKTIRPEGRSAPTNETADRSRPIRLRSASADADYRPRTWWASSLEPLLRPHRPLYGGSWDDETDPLIGDAAGWLSFLSCAPVLVAPVNPCNDN